MSLVFIHGRAQEGFHKEELEKKWLDALNTGVSKSRYAGRYLPPDAMEFPYYARILVPSPQDSTRSAADTKRNAECLEFFRQFRSEVEAEREFSAVIARGVAHPVTPAFGRSADNANILRSLANLDDDYREVQNWSATIGLARLLDRWKGGSTAFLDEFLPDIERYLQDKNVREEIDQLVADAIKRTSEPRVVVAHSLGTVIAFRVLSTTAARFRVRHLMTLGSPLTVKAVHSRLGVARTVPDGVERWSNFSDLKDIVALRTTIDRRTFFPNEPKGRADVENFTDIDNTTENHHSIEGYLSDPLLAARIVEAIQ